MTLLAVLQVSSSTLPPQPQCTNVSLRLISQDSRSPCTLGAKYGCHEDGESMWVRSCRGTFRCGDGPEVPCGFPPGQPSYRRRRCIKPTEPKAKGDRSFAELTSAALKRQGKVTGLINNLFGRRGQSLQPRARAVSSPMPRALPASSTFQIWDTPRGTTGWSYIGQGVS